MSVSKEEAIDPILDKYLAAGKPMCGNDLKQLIFDCMDAWVTAQLSAPNTGKGGVWRSATLETGLPDEYGKVHWRDANSKMPLSAGVAYSIIKLNKLDVLKTIEWLDETSSPISVGDGWIKCEDSPLYTADKDDCWTLTENGGKEFLAAIPYENSSKTDEKNLWWIRHCVIDDSGLRVVTDDDTEPAGYSLSDVTHYKLILPPPPVK